MTTARFLWSFVTTSLVVLLSACGSGPDPTHWVLQLGIDPVGNTSSGRDTEVRDIALSGGYVFAGDWTGFTVFRINRGTDAVTAGHVESKSANGIKNLALTGHHLVVVDMPGFRVFDVASPEAPVEVASLNLLHPPTALVFDGTTGFGTSSTGLETFDFSDPTQPRSLATWNVKGGLGSLILADGNAWTSNSDNGLMLFSVSNPADPRPLGQWPEFKFWSMALHEKVLFTSGPGRIFTPIIDVSTPTAPRKIGELEDVTTGSNSGSGAAAVAFVHGKLARCVTTSALAGTYLYDVSTPAKPKQLALWEAWPLPSPYSPSRPGEHSPGLFTRFHFDDQHAYLAGPAGLGIWGPSGK